MDRLPHSLAALGSSSSFLISWSNRSCLSAGRSWSVPSVGRSPPILSRRRRAATRPEPRKEERERGAAPLSPPISCRLCSFRDSSLSLRSVPLTPLTRRSRRRLEGAEAETSGRRGSEAVNGRTTNLVRQDAGNRERPSPPPVVLHSHPLGPVSLRPGGPAYGGETGTEGHGEW